METEEKPHRKELSEVPEPIREWFRRQTSAGCKKVVSGPWEDKKDPAGAYQQPGRPDGVSAQKKSAGLAAGEGCSGEENSQKEEPAGQTICSFSIVPCGLKHRINPLELPCVEAVPLSECGDLPGKSGVFLIDAMDHSLIQLLRFPIKGHASVLQSDNPVRKLQGKLQVVAVHQNGDTFRFLDFF